MNNDLSRLWLSTPIALLAVVSGGFAAANENPAKPATEGSARERISQVSGVAEIPTFNGDAIRLPTNPLASQPGLEQVTSISQLSDVTPTDWAFQALQSLIERYSCIVGYPDRTFRGNRALSRYEFAAGLNACMDRINDLIAQGTVDLVKKSDLMTLQKLQEEFAAELKTLRGRVDALEARTSKLEAQQFSTTTKLTGQVWFNLTGAFSSGGNITAERSLAVPNNPNAAPARTNPAVAGSPPTRVQRSNPNITFSYYAFLNFSTSFTGKDLLFTQMAVGNGNSPANQFVSAGFFNSWGTPFLDQSGTTATGTFVLRELFYSFPATDNLQVSVGPKLNYYRYFDGNRFTFFLNGASSFNSNGSTLSNAIDRGSGAVIAWTLSKEWRITVGYLAENTEFLNANFGFNTSSSPKDGLFNASNTISAEVVYSPSSNLNLRLHYSRTNLKPYASFLNGAGFIGGAVGEPLPYGFADDGFGGRIQAASADTFIFNFDWLVTPGFGLFGRYSYGSTDIIPANPLRPTGEVNTQAFQFGFGFPDLGKKGALGVLSFVIPHDYVAGRQFLLSGGGNGATQYELEASYFYPVSDNVAIVPAFYAIFNPNSFSTNPTVFVGNVRTQFRF